MAVAAILGDGETKSEYSEFAMIFDNDIAKACYKLKPQLDSWIKQQYPNVSINALALDAAASFFTAKDYPNSYSDILMFLKKLKRLESEGIRPTIVAEFLPLLQYSQKSPYRFLINPFL